MQVDRVQLGPGLGLDGFDRLLPVEAGAMHQDIEPGARAARQGGDADSRGDVGHVDTRGLAGQARDTRELGPVPADEVNCQAFIGKRQGDGAADPAACTRDEGRLAREEGGVRQGVRPLA
jgi:hypothetical protein